MQRAMQRARPFQQSSREDGVQSDDYSSGSPPLNHFSNKAVELKNLTERIIRLHFAATGMIPSIAPQNKHVNDKCLRNSAVQVIKAHICVSWL